MTDLLEPFKFLGRRICSFPILFLLTYHETEPGSDHPLRSAFGELPGHALARLLLARFLTYHAN